MNLKIKSTLFIMSSDEDMMSRADFLNLLKTKDKPLLVKFTADWCGPCKRVKPLVDNFLTQDVMSRLQYLEIDIDHSVDVYAYMKTKRMLNGIPTLFFYEKSNTNFPPSYSVSTGNEAKVNEFLKGIGNCI